MKSITFSAVLLLAFAGSAHAESMRERYNQAMEYAEDGAEWMEEAGKYTSVSYGMCDALSKAHGAFDWTADALDSLYEDSWKYSDEEQAEIDDLWSDKESARQTSEEIFDTSLQICHGMSTGYYDGTGPND